MTTPSKIRAEAPEGAGPAPRAYAAAVGAFLLLAAGLLASVLHATGGVFSFTLDDPYIHLAMAEEIGRGGYGVNPGEPASASSSVLYPFLLAALLKLGLGQWGALAVNLAAGAASTALLVALAGEGGLVDARTPVWRIAALAGLLALALNLGGLAFTGMEHGLHAALALAALLGLARLGRTGRVDAWLVAALILAPLVRLEGMAMTGAGGLALLWRRRWAAAAGVAVATALALGGYAVFLHGLGLPPLPSSVLAKAGDGAHGFGAQLLENLHAPGAPIVLAGALSPLLARRGGPAAFASLALLAQLAVGSFGVRYAGWLHRYEAWAVVLAAGLVLLTTSVRLRAWLAQGPTLRATLAAALLLLALAPYVRTTAETALNARSIRLQQREMRRFAAEVLRAPVAVNDLGWVSWRNDGRVLDLWGLASEPARRARQSHAPPEWMDALARREGVRAVMIYDRWIGRVPAGWVRLGELRARVPLTVGPAVAFYAVDARDAPAVRAAVAAWARGLPAQDVFAPASP